MFRNSNPQIVSLGASVVFESASTQLRVEPADIRLSEGHIHNGRIGVIPLLITSDVLGARGRINALVEADDGRVLEAMIEVIDTVSIEAVLPPETGMEFRPSVATAQPHVRRNLQLWVDSEVIPVGSDIVVRLFDQVQGLFLLTEDDQTVVTRTVRCRERDRHVTNPRVLRLLVPFRGTGYGQFGAVRANASGGQIEASAQIRIREYEPPAGAGIFSDLDYDARTRSHYACIFDRGSGKLVVNSCHPVNGRLFGETFEDFNRAIETSTDAQIRLAEIVLDECIYHIAAKKYLKGGEHGLDLRADDPITSIRNFIEETKFRIGPRVFNHFVPSLQ